MGLREIFHTAALTIFDAVDNVPEIGTLHHLGYAASSQPTGEATVPNLRAVRQQYDIEKMNNVDTLRNQREYIVIAHDLGAVVPQEDDTLQFGSEVWTIFLVQPDEVSASYTLSVRR